MIGNMSSSNGEHQINFGPVDELRRQLWALKSEVTSQQFLLDALEVQSAQYRALFELMPGSVLLLDSRGFIRDTNPYFCQITGYKREELIGMHLSDISQQKMDVVERNILRMISGETLQHDVIHRHKDGILGLYEMRSTAAARWINDHPGGLQRDYDAQKGGLKSTVGRLPICEIRVFRHRLFHELPDSGTVESHSGGRRRLAGGCA
jgi:PAS domain S-box-containing protein